MSKNNKEQKINFIATIKYDDTIVSNFRLKRDINFL